MSKNYKDVTRAGNPADALHVARAGRGPSAEAIAYGFGGVPSTGQAARSEFDALTNPRQGGEGYDATLASDAPIPDGKVSNPVPPVRKDCPPGANQGSDYHSTDSGFRIRRTRKSG